MMSQRIVTECDECLALGETRSAATVGVRALSIEVEVDLCDVHVKPLVELVERLAELGRAPGADSRGVHRCPRCSRSFATPQALGRHARDTHGEKVAALRKAPSPAPVEAPVEDGVACPECGKRSATGQGLAVHRRRKHGVVGASRASAARRAAGEDGAPSGE
jgi:DNA-directed RNA polymerase subunit RPC12/RpoP